MPVLLICGDRNVYFAEEVVEEVVEETAHLIPDCTLLRYRGQTHPQVVAGSRQAARDVLGFAR